MSRTTIAVLLAFIFAAALPAEDPPKRIPRTDWTDTKIESLAREIHAKHLTIDTHFDIPIVLKRPGFDMRRKYSWFNHASQIDFPRMKEGGIDGGFFVVYVGRGPLDHPSREKAVKMGFQISELIHDTVTNNTDLAEIALTPADAERIRKLGKHVDLIGIDRIGISGDFDGGGGVKGAMDVSQMIEVTKEMLRRGYSEDDLKKFWGGNAMRVLQASTDYAASLKPAEKDKQDS